MNKEGREEKERKKEKVVMRIKSSKRTIRTSKIFSHSNTHTHTKRKREREIERREKGVMIEY
jgi:hypothetical protein